MLMDRRTFMRTCAGTVACSAVAGTLVERLAGAGELVTYQKSRLVDASGQPLKASELSTSEAYVFNYPMKGTPCFLIRLGSEARPAELKPKAGQPYAWSGGVGPQKDIVAYSAICPHQLAYTKKASSAISYQAGASEIAEGRKGMITCCAHDSVFDPANGASVVSGPAKQPLTAIRLEHDPADDGLYAVGVYGGALFDDFFKAFKADLNEQYGRGVYRQAAESTVPATLLSKYDPSALAC